MIPLRRYRDSSEVRDWVRAAVQGALADAAVEAADTDAVMLASETDFMSLPLVPGTLLLDEIGLSGLTVMRAESGSASDGAALRAGLMPSSPDVRSGC